MVPIGRLAEAQEEHTRARKENEGLRRELKAWPWGVHDGRQAVRILTPCTRLLGLTLSMLALWRLREGGERRNRPPPKRGAVGFTRPTGVGCGRGVRG